MLEAVEARIREDQDRLDAEDLALLGDALRSASAQPPFLVEQVGRLQWRVTLGTWEESGPTRKAALRRFRLRYGITPHVRPVDWSKGPR